MVLKMYSDIYDIVLKLLGKKTPSEQEKALIEFAVCDSESRIKSYCNIQEIPKGLETTAARLAVDLYRSEGYGSEDMPRQVTSVKRGDVTTSFADTSNSNILQTDFIEKYKPMLNSFRKLRW